MYVINQGLNGGWYGHVEAETSDVALAEARELDRILTELRYASPTPAKTPTTRAKPAKGINPAGLACLAYCEANPHCTHTEYLAAGHTLRTVKWLRDHGYLKSVGDTWTVDREGKLEP